ncbi:unnamed protein product [Rotaria magnacalcarata]|uniref:HAT C-terminal dimerisation domain-containing protein n=1 Tax=Rotaria magnacalcarata TaxID=392030 RepID=A0A816RQ63_9BILA|nr:unnamed protein product [Rotaria magnacalcarata]
MTQTTTIVVQMTISMAQLTIRVIIDSNIDEHDTERPFRDYFTNILNDQKTECAMFANENFQKYNENSYYNPNYVKCTFSLYLPVAPIWSNLVIGNLGRYGYRPAELIERCGCHNSRTTGISESRLEVIKHTVLQGEVTSRIDQAQSLTSSNQSSITKPSNKEQQSSQATMLQNFFITCGIKLQATSTSFKPSTIKEEITQYVVTINLYQTFNQYWYANKDRLPIFSSFVRQYNIMCATSIDYESSFNIADFLHHKNRSSLSPSTLRYSMILREQVKNKQT